MRCFVKMGGAAGLTVMGFQLGPLFSSCSINARQVLLIEEKKKGRSKTEVRT